MKLGGYVHVHIDFNCQIELEGISLYELFSNHQMYFFDDTLKIEVASRLVGEICRN